MIKHYLESAIKDIENLIKMTKDDIEDIKQANHESIFKRTSLKDELIKSFSNKKALLDNDLAKLLENNPNIPLEELLSEEEHKFLSTLQEKLALLHKENKAYAKLVVAVGEFYTSLVNKMFPNNENVGYDKSKIAPARILEVNV